MCIAEAAVEVPVLIVDNLGILQQSVPKNGTHFSLLFFNFCAKLSKLLLVMA